MYAVLKTGGKQYRVEPGDVLRVEKIEAEAGATVRLDEILMIGGGTETAIGSPFLDGARVEAEVLGQVRGEKVIHFVRRRRKHSSKRTKGHRQHLTELRITEILASGEAPRAHGAQTPAPADEAAPEPATTDAPEIEGEAGPASAPGTAAGIDQAPDSTEGALDEPSVIESQAPAEPQASGEAAEAPVATPEADARQAQGAATAGLQAGAATAGTVAKATKAVAGTQDNDGARRDEE